MFRYKLISAAITLMVAQLVSLPSFGQTTVHSFEQLDSLQQTNPKSVVVFIYTDWCQYCQIMKNTTLKNDEVIELLKEKFWFASLNAEDKNEIFFHGRKFGYKPTGGNTGVHELAEQLGTINGKLSYPTLCILNPEYEIIFQYGQLISASDLIKVLNQALKGN